jgi:mannose-1-phosphate guanylyltransferase
VAAPPDTAMVLAAGRGTRLHTVTDRLPKCMVPIAGRPLIEHTVERLAHQGVTRIIINLHHLGEVIAEHFGDGRRFGVEIRYSREEELLGTAGGVKRALDRGLLGERFLVWYGDNLSQCRLDDLTAVHRAHAAEVTVALHHREDPTQSGIVGMDERGLITRFLEKPRPEQVFSRWVNAGIYVVEATALAEVPDGFSDFGRELFPRLLSAGRRLAGYPMDASEDLLWVDSPEDLARTEAAVRSPGKQKDLTP